MKKMRKIIAVMLAVCMVCMGSTVATAEQPDELVDFVVFQDNDRVVMASVPKNKVEEFQSLLENPDYRQQQVDNIMGLIDNQDSKVLPEGNILSQQYLGASEIEEFVDAASGTGTCSLILSGVAIVTPAIVKQIIQSAKVSSAAGLAASIFAASISFMLAQQEAWWTTSYIKILNNEISYVRYSIIENPNEYPKIWRVLDRI